MKNRTLFFVGIKGTGMAALARICYKLGYEVKGSDIDNHFFTEDELRLLEIPIVDFSAINIQDNMTVILGNAFDDSHVEVKAAKENDTVTVYRYHDFLSKLMKDHRSIAVSGSHGKTTTTTLLRDMLSYTKETGYLIGDGRGDLMPDDEYFVVEACEYRGHFLSYHPDVAIMTNFEIDHVDFFKSEAQYLEVFEEFSKNVKELLIIWGDDPHFKDMKFHQKVWTYGFNEAHTVSAQNVIQTTQHSEFDVYYNQVFYAHFKLPIVGNHMILDALSVIAVGIYDGIESIDIERGLNQFKGAKRRFVIEEGKENIYIDDYAHHPSEVKVTIEATRTRYPDKKIVAIFKPHRVGRVYYFADKFAETLSMADEVCLMPFTSIDDKEEGIDIDIYFLKDMIKGAHVVEEDDESVDLLESFAPCVYLFMSSKDIYDFKDLVKKRFND